MLQWVVDAAEASQLDRVVIVTANGDADIRSIIKTERAYFARNPDPERGTMSSLRAGVDAGGPADAVMKLVGDQPEVTAEDIDAMLDAWDPDRYATALASYRDGRGHPLLVTRDVLDKVLHENGDRLLWRLVESEGPHAVTIDRSQPVDVNTPGDLDRVRDRLR